ncbi:hypothetical protein [Serratia liquefaciens]|uniref:hypothetical protein n=1 Tax=Serratia liquefaciens TaxID=614 RepID=UPI002FD787C7
MSILASDDCNTWRNGGKSLINWSGEDCSPNGLIKSINKTPSNIPVFYAAYHEYGNDGVRAINVRDTSKLNYLNFAYDLSKQVSSPSVVSRIYEDYVLDRKSMGLSEVSQAYFVEGLNEFSLKKDALYQEMNRVAKVDYDSSNASTIGEKLGVDYKAVCGPFTIDLSPADGWSRINGAKPESQKIRRIGPGKGVENVKMEWRVSTNQPGKWLGLEFIKRDGKAFLNAQLLQASMDAPRQYATYDCKKIK